MKTAVILSLATAAMAIWPPPPESFHLVTKGPTGGDGQYTELYLSTGMSIPEAENVRLYLSKDEPSSTSFQWGDDTALTFHSKASKEVLSVNFQDAERKFKLFSLSNCDRTDGFTFNSDDQLEYHNDKLFYACKGNGDSVELRYWEGPKPLSMDGNFNGCEQVVVEKKTLPHIISG